mmetsp:Transcript_24365/g.24631  ORF Transcript_24365/g.24631 Transcript_24365/m.24631 type:complete len:524 (-) Transcript_24365:8-1579(-)
MKNVLSDLSSLPIFVLSLLFYSSTIVGVDGFVPLKPTRIAATRTATRTTRTSSRLYYDIQRDSSNVWSVLTTTEKWICQTLADAAQTPGIKKGRTNHKKEGKGDKDDDNIKKNTNTNTNPFSRKEVHYVCETSNNVAIIVASIFRNIKEAREIGEAHGHGHDQDHDHDHDHDQDHDQNRQQRRLSPSSPSSSLRQTLIVVIPANEELNNDFQIFNNLFDSINQARRVARDYVTDHSLEGSTETMENNDVSVRCAHLHPKYAEQTPEQELEEMKQDELKGEIDVNLREYKKHKILARRSPYPSIVIEILAMTMPVVNESEDSRTTDNDDDTDSIPSASSSSLSSSTSPSSFDSNDDDDDGVGDNMKIDSKYLQQLEALFSKSSLNNNDDDTTTSSSNNNNNGDDFYESIGSHIEEVSAIPTATTPLILAQNWIETNDHDASLIVGGGRGTTHKCAACTLSNATHVDEAYEFVFTNLGMQASKYLDTKPETEKQIASDGDGDSDSDSDSDNDEEWMMMVVVAGLL